jgi:tetratricopeptide (TPR) repeat protein
MNGFGDVYRRNGELQEARHWYECAMTPATAAKDPIILSTVGRSLADLSYKQGRFAEAEQYYDGVEKLAAHTLDAETKAWALEWRGMSQEQQHTDDRAVESWKAAALLSRSIGMPASLQRNLTNLARVYARLGRREEFSKVKAELDALQAQEVAV